MSIFYAQICQSAKGLPCWFNAIPTFMKEYEQEETCLDSLSYQTTLSKVKMSAVLLANLSEMSCTKFEFLKRKAIQNLTSIQQKYIATIIRNHLPKVNSHFLDLQMEIDTLTHFRGLALQKLTDCGKAGKALSEKFQILNNQLAVALQDLENIYATINNQQAAEANIQTARDKISSTTIERTNLQHQINVMKTLFRPAYVRERTLMECVGRMYFKIIQATCEINVLKLIRPHEKSDGCDYKEEFSSVVTTAKH